MISKLETIIKRSIVAGIISLSMVGGAYSKDMSDYDPSSGIIGEDTRVRVTKEMIEEEPYIKSIGLIYINSDEGNSQCTGTLFTDNYVLTNAHCVFNRDKVLADPDENTAVGWVKGVQFYPGLTTHPDRSNIKPIGWEKMFVFKQYLYPDEGDDLDNTENDFALIKLSSSGPNSIYGSTIPEKTSFDRFLAASIGRQVHKLDDAITIGYPGDKPFGTLWVAEGKLFTGGEGIFDSSKTLHTCDVYAGTSGSVVLTRNNFLHSPFVGLNSSGYSGDLTEDLVKILKDKGLDIFMDKGGLHYKFNRVINPDGNLIDIVRSFASGGVEMYIEEDPETVKEYIYWKDNN